MALNTTNTWNPDMHTLFGPIRIKDSWPDLLPKKDWVITDTATVPEETAKNIAKQLANIPIKADTGKPDVTLIPYEAVEEIAKVLEFGAKKYARDNWKAGTGFKYTRIIASLLRHIYAYLRGEDNDPESGLSHMAHAGCNVMFLLYYEKYKAKYSNDDRA